MDEYRKIDRDSIVGVSDKVASTSRGMAQPRAPRVSGIARMRVSTARRSRVRDWDELGLLERDARIMMQSYQWEEALESCKEVLASDPDHLGALEVMAQAQWFGGFYDDVIRTTSRLLMLNPHEPGYRYTRGMAHMSRGELYRAAEDFRRAIAQSDHPGFRSQVAQSLDAVEMWIEDRSSTEGSRGSGVRPLPGMGLPELRPGRFH